MTDRLTHIAIVNLDRCKPKKCRQESKKSCPVVKTGELCLEVISASKITFISEELCIGYGICVKGSYVLRLLRHQRSLSSLRSFASDVVYVL
ncbi:hypothetical protein Droror1_Dr00019687, partial [Drosera rotundifolia]